MLGYSEDSRLADRALAALSHPYRRRLLFELYSARDGTLDVRPDALFPELEPEGTAIALAHVHLPKLERDGYITWERGDPTVTTGDDWDRIEPLLDVIHTHRDELPAGLRGDRQSSTPAA